MASAQQLIGLVKSHAEGDVDRFYDLAMQLSAAEEQKGHTRLAEQLRQWADAGQKAPTSRKPEITPIAAPRGDMAQFLAASYPTERLVDVILPTRTEDELAHIVVETKMREKLEEKGLKPRRRVLLSGPPGTGKTLSAFALAGELQFPLFSVMLHGLITKFMGETAQKLRMVFDAVKTTRGVYLFDEIDALAAARGGGETMLAKPVGSSTLFYSFLMKTQDRPSSWPRPTCRAFSTVQFSVVSIWFFPTRCRMPLPSDRLLNAA